MYNYYNFINETVLTHGKKDLNLEFNDKGRKMLPFIYYFTLNKYIILKRINFDEYQPNTNRVTFLTGSTYLDNEISNKRNYLLENKDFDNENYFFYKIVSYNFQEDNPSIVSIPYDETKFNDQLTYNNKVHFIVIKKNTNVTSVRININQRHTFGYNAEQTISDKFGWSLKNTKIKSDIVKVINGNKQKAFLTDILKTDLDTLNRYQDLFQINNINTPLNKYDLIIKEGEHIGKKIEVKKYNMRSLFYKDDITPKTLMMAEQLKIATKPGLKKLVTLYHEMNPDIDVSFLLNNFNLDKGEKLSKFFRKDDNPIVEDIKKFYNDRINYMLNKFSEINNIMTDIFGIYFFNNKTGVDGFLILNHEINYTWRAVNSQWGLKRIKILFTINPNADKYVWIGNRKTFVKTFKVNDFDAYKELKRIDKISEHKPIIKNTDIGTIKWNSTEGYWESVDNYDDTKTIDLKKSYKNESGK